MGSPGRVYADPAYAAVVTRMKRTLDALRAQYRAPAKDPVPYVPLVLPPEYRRDPADTAALRH